LKELARLLKLTITHYSILSAIPNWNARSVIDQVAKDVSQALPKHTITAHLQTPTHNPML
jgi:hypothetical protein